MIYRALGVVSLAVGGIFGIVTMLVLLPFLDNFNLTLLILAGVFAILAYVFVAIGLQLFHPPGERGRRPERHEGHAGAETSISPATPGVGDVSTASGADHDETASPVEPTPARAAAPVSDTSAEPAVQGTFPLPEPTPAAPSKTSSDADEPPSGHEVGESSNGGASFAHPVVTHTGFKKPGEAVPRD